MKDRLKIEFRQKQLFYNQDPLQPIVVTCTLGAPTYTPGTVDSTWVDMTEHTEGLDKLRLSWSASKDFGEGGVSDTNEVGSNYQKGLSIDLKFHAKAFNYIFNWLMLNPCQILNAIEVRITDNECRKPYRLFEIKVDNIKYAVDEPCIVSMALRELDDTIHSFQKTIIEDNWQGWFNADGTSTKDHPTFSMIVEKKPKLYLAIFATLVYMVGILCGALPFAITARKAWTRRAFGFSYFCPAPLIRTYIENICLKYGYTFDTIFDDLPGNDYRDLCLFFPASKIYVNFEDYTSPNTKFIWDNRTVLPFSRFLNQLKSLFNAEWYVTPGKKLVFKHKDYFNTLAPLYDFTAPGADKIFHLEYTFNGKKKPAYGDYQYKVDPQDTCSNEIKWRYNDIVDYDGPANNPMLEGHVTKDFDFAMTAFHKDGTQKDFLEDGIKLGRTIAEAAIGVGLAALFLETNPILGGLAALWFIAGYVATNSFVNDFFDSEDLNGMVRSSSSEINIPRLLLWDRNTPVNQAKVVSVVDPTQNLYYNTVPTTYYEEHPAHDAPVGYFGTEVRKIYNYPMYIESKFNDNMFDRFHEYDNPLKNPEINQDWEGEVDMCCDWLERLGTFDPGSIKIGAVFVLEKRGDRFIKGRTEFIEPDYDKGRIVLKGTVLK